jgi:flavin reductase (DIM6/NTAB) family NADH-FMN oxidoreductase RutF
LTVLTTTSNGVAHGITVNSFTSVSLDPPLILFCIDKKARFNKPLTAEKSLAINILSEEQQEISNRFANPSMTSEERFSGLQLLSDYAYPVFDDNVGVLIAQLHQTHGGGDHWIYIAKVIKGQSFAGNPLLYHAGSYSRVNSKS